MLSERSSGPRLPSEESGAPVTLARAASYFLRLATLTKAYWSRLVSVVALGGLVSGVALIIPLITKSFIDDVYPNHEESYVVLLVLALFVLSLTSSALGALRGFATQITASTLSGVTTLLFFNHLQHQPVRFFDTHRVGELTSRFNDVRSSLGTLARVFDTLLLNGLYVLVVPPVLFMMQWQLAFLSLTALPITTAVTLLSGRALRGHIKRVTEARAELSAYQLDVLSQIRTIKLSAAERMVYDRAYKATQGIVDLQAKSTGLSSIITLSNGIVRCSVLAAYTWFAWHLLIQDRLTLGEFIAFSAYLGYLTGPVGQIASLFGELQQSSIALARMFEYLDAPAEATPSAIYESSYRIKVPISGPIVFDRVQFGYRQDRRVLEDISFSAEPSTVTALIGQSGVGKSSVIRLLAGLEPVTGGDIYVSGVSLGRLDVRDIRHQIAVVWQEVGIIRGTILENLTLGCADVTAVTLEDVLEICDLRQLVEDADRGLQTPIGEWGATLSGGQRQRIGLARALMRNTPILAIDEGTSNLDSETEYRILSKLFDRMRQRGVTTIVVTHRTSTLTQVDQVCAIEEGRVRVERPYGAQAATITPLASRNTEEVSRATHRLVRV